MHLSNSIPITERMHITNSGSVYIGATTSPTGTYKLYVAGNSYFGGTTTASGTKTFDIPHPTLPHHRLRHRYIESPEARLLYEFQMDCLQGANSMTLPGYFAPLNTNPRVYCSPYRNLGAACGEVVGDQLHVTTSSSGLYNILLLGTRNDRAAQEECLECGVEYPG